MSSFPGKPELIARYRYSFDSHCVEFQFTVKTWMELRLEEVEAELESLKSREGPCFFDPQESSLIRQQMWKLGKELNELRGLMFQLGEFKSEYLKEAEEEAKILKQYRAKLIWGCTCMRSDHYFFRLDDAALHLQYEHGLPDAKIYKRFEHFVDKLLEYREKWDEAVSKRKSRAEIRADFRELADRIIPLLKYQNYYTLEKIFGQFPRWDCPCCPDTGPHKTSIKNFILVSKHLIEDHDWSPEKAATHINEWLDRTLRGAVSNI